LHIPTYGTQIAITKVDLHFTQRSQGMLGKLTTMPTGILIDILYAILTGDVLSATHMAEIEQIHRELEKRGEEQRWSFDSVN
jgi:hypothetical protein